MEESLVPVGTIALNHCMVQENGVPTGKSALNIDAQGCFQQMTQSREGLLEIHAFLLQAAKVIAHAVAQAPAAAEAPKVAIVPASALPKMPFPNGSRFN